MGSDLALIGGIAVLVTIGAMGAIIGLVHLFPQAGSAVHSIYDVPATVTAVRDRHGVVWCREFGMDVWGDKAGRLRHTSVLSGPLTELARRNVSPPREAS